MVLLSRVERLSGAPKASKDLLLREQFMDNLKDLTLCRDIKRWERDHPAATFQDVQLEVHRNMEEDPTPKRSAAARSAEVEEEAQFTEITGQKKQQKVLADLISGQKVLAKELQKQQKVLMAHVEKQREVLGQQQETCSPRWLQGQGFHPVTAVAGMDTSSGTALSQRQSPAPKGEGDQSQRKRARNQDSIAVSPAVEEVNSGSPLPKIVGGTPTITARMAGVEVECLINTGSMVTLVLEDFYKEKLESVCGRVHGVGRMPTLRGANGLEIPYLRYLQLDMQVGGVTIPDCGVLVLKDTAATVWQRRRRPRVLEMNVFAKIPKWLELLSVEENASTSSKLSQKPSKQRLVRVAGSSAVWIPPYSAMNVNVTGSACGENTVVEPLSQGSKLATSWSHMRLDF